MKSSVIVSGASLLGSLAGFYYAKNKAMDTIPPVLIGGFIGAMLGESIASKTSPSKKLKAHHESRN